MAIVEAYVKQKLGLKWQTHLVPKLVTREAENAQTLAAVFGIQALQLGVVLVG